MSFHSADYTVDFLGFIFKYRIVSDLMVNPGNLLKKSTLSKKFGKYVTFIFCAFKSCSLKFQLQEKAANATEKIFDACKKIDNLEITVNEYRADNEIERKLSVLNDSKRSVLEVISDVIILRNVLLILFYI